MGSLHFLGLEAWQRASGEGVLITDAAGRICSLNPRLQTLLGLERDPVSVDDLLDQTRLSLPDLATVLAPDSAHSAPRCGSMLVPQPGMVRLHWEQMPLVAHHGQVGTCTIFRDVTAAAERNQSKQSFLAMISHDLRTPLSAILGFSELLRHNLGTLPDTVQQELLDGVIRNANDLSRLTQVTLDVMYLEANVEAFSLETVPLDRFVRHWLDDAAHRFPAEQLLFHASASPMAPAQIAPSALHRILQILVEFALAESPPGRPVELSLENNTNHAHLRVRHEAPNLTHEDAVALFEVFRPRDLSEHARPQLHRIQLYVATLLAERQHGLLTLREEPGAAFQFDLALPVDAAS